MNDQALTSFNAPVAPARATSNFDPQALLAIAFERGAALDTIERLLDIQKTLHKEQAQREFDDALARFQADCPVIGKNRHVVDNKTGAVRYSYADLGTIVQTVKGLLAAEGFSYTIKTTQEGDYVNSCVEVAHTGGHRQTSEFRVPMDPKAFMSEPQKASSAATYSKRVAFVNAFGILTGDDDDDNDIAHPSRKSEVLVDAERQQALSALGRLGVTIFGKEGVADYLAFCGADPAKMTLDEIKDTGARLKAMWQARKAAAEASSEPTEMIEQPPVQSDADAPEEPKDDRPITKAQQKAFWATAREHWVLDGTFVGDELVYWFLETRKLAPFDEAKGRVSLSLMTRENLSFAIDLLKNTQPAALVEAYRKSIEEPGQ